MSPTAPRALSGARDRVGESPLWDAAAQAYYWVDIEGRRLHRLDWSSQARRSWNMPERVGCIALAGRGGLLAAMETGIFTLQPGEDDAPACRQLVPLQHPLPNMRCNDGRCDRAGRFWVSTLCMDGHAAHRVGAWWRLDERGLQRSALDGLITANGLAFSPDGRRMYFSDSHPSVQTIWRCDYDQHTGEPGLPAPWIAMTPLPGRPDGAAVDAEGCYWICGNDAGLVHRFDPDGRLLGSVAVPVPKPAMCAFGGPALDTLLVTSIRPAGPDDGLSGSAFLIDVGVRGLPEPVFTRYPTC